LSYEPDPEIKRKHEEFMIAKKPAMHFAQFIRAIFRGVVAVFIIGMPVNHIHDRSAAASSVSHAGPIHPVSALLKYYGQYIQEIEWTENDIVLHLEKGSIHYRDGKMLNRENLEHEDRFSSIFYHYPTSPLKEAIEKPASIARRSDDFYKMIFGETEREIRKHCREIRFLHRMAFVNTLCIPALKQVEAEILRQAEENPDVASFVKNIRILYSFKQKEIVGSQNSSFHGYGLAVDLVPRSYDKKHVYWKWSAVYYKDWHRIPVQQRWSPPQPVIDAFERNGFVWGGKWVHFDVIHFEYRPEIIVQMGENGVENVENGVGPS